MEDTTNQTSKKGDDQTKVTGLKQPKGVFKKKQNKKPSRAHGKGNAGTLGVDRTVILDERGKKKGATTKGLKSVWSKSGKKGWGKYVHSDLMFGKKTQRRSGGGNLRAIGTKGPMKRGESRRSHLDYRDTSQMRRSDGGT